MVCISRSVVGSAGTDFARQLAEHNAQGQQRPGSKFRASAAPKGVKLPSGYRDRTQDRAPDTGSRHAEDDKAVRIQALEEMVKLGQMDQAQFERVRADIVGGDVSTTHLIKGLDYKLLERVRRGEDVLQEKPSAEDESTAPNSKTEAELDEEFAKIEAREVVPIVKEKESKVKDMGPPPRPVYAPPSVAGKKRTRDDILAELRAARKAGGAAGGPAQPTLGPKFRKVGQKREETRIERDEKGREVLIITDEDGKVKRKVRRAQPGGNNDRVNEAKSINLPMPDKDVTPLGMEVPEAYRGKGEDGEEETGDIFDDAGSDYDPLAGLVDDDDDEGDDDDDGEEGEVLEDGGPGTPIKADTRTAKSPEHSASHNNEQRVTVSDSIGSHTSPVKPRNYFSSVSEAPPEDDARAPNPLSDPAILAALRKASTLDPSRMTGKGEDTKDDDADEVLRRRRRHEQMLAATAHDRDAEDMDLGFGSSRVEDEEMDDDGKRIKLSAWGDVGAAGSGGGRDEGARGDKGGKAKRKRGPKKKKGDPNSAADVLRVMEQRKKGDA